MRITLSITLLIFLTSLIVSAYSSPDSQTKGGELVLREPFALELPDIGGEAITQAQASIPTADLHMLRLKVKKPFADSINYGSLHLRINGESADTIREIRADRDGYIIACDLDSKPRFRLHPGKNVIEISATDRSNRPYYASYVLLTGGSPPGDLSTGSVTIEYEPLKSGNDRQPPKICLSRPKGAVRFAGSAFRLDVSGSVADDSGAIAYVKVNGQTRPVAQTIDDRGVAANLCFAGMPAKSRAVTFQSSINIKADMPPVTIEAADLAGNITRLKIPVRRGDAGVSPRFQGRKFAVVIGISRYKYKDGGLNDLQYADADARSIRDFLESPEGGRFAPSSILYMENEQATLDGVRASLKSFLPKAGPNDLVFFFIAGHGSPDPYAPQKLYFMLYDTKVADMPNTALPMNELQEVLDHNLRARRVLVFVDTCHSAGLSGEKIVTTRSLENNLVNLYAAKLFGETGRAVLTSSDVNEVSLEDQRWGGGHGVFTLALLDGLRGEADANSDNLISAGELFAYVRDRVRIETAFHQNPQVLPGLNADLTLAFVLKK